MKYNKARHLLPRTPVAVASNPNQKEAATEFEPRMFRAASSRLAKTTQIVSARYPPQAHFYPGRELAIAKMQATENKDEHDFLPGTKTHFSACRRVTPNQAANNRKLIPQDNVAIHAPKEFRRTLSRLTIAGTLPSLTASNTSGYEGEQPLALNLLPILHASIIE